MNRYFNPQPKKEQLDRSPGNRKSKAAKSNKAQGNELEKDVAKALGGRRNHQGRAGGGISNPDVSAMRDWAIECKNTDRLELPKWLKNLKAETPPEKKPGLVYSFESDLWITIRLADRVNFATDLIEQAGYDISPR